MNHVVLWWNQTAGAAGARERKEKKKKRERMAILRRSIVSRCVSCPCRVCQRDGREWGRFHHCRTRVCLCVWEANARSWFQYQIGELETNPMGDNEKRDPHTEISVGAAAAAAAETPERNNKFHHSLSLSLFGWPPSEPPVWLARRGIYRETKEEEKSCRRTKELTSFQWQTRSHPDAPSTGLLAFASCVPSSSLDTQKRLIV